MSKKKLNKNPVNKEIPKKQILILGFIIAVLSFLVYSNSLKNGYVLDDFSVIKENYITKQGFDGIKQHLTHSYRYGYWNKTGTLYRPLSLVMFAIEWELFPDNPMPGHFINVLFYALTGLLLFLTLVKILKNYNIIIPFIATLIFMFHPVHTEVVANIKSRDEIMSLFFVVITINLLWSYLLKNNKITLLVFSIISYFLAIMSKEGVVTIVAVIPLTIYFFTDVKLKKNIIISAFFIIPVVVYLIIRKKVLGDIGGLSDTTSVIDNLLQSVKDEPSKWYATAVSIMGKYLVKLVWPYPLAADYSYNQIPVVGFGSIKAIISLLTYLGLGIYALLKIKKKSLLSYAILFYLITMSIYSNIFITIGSSFGERFLYVPSLGFALALSYILTYTFNKKDTKYFYFDKLKSFFSKHLTIIAITALLVLVYSVITIKRNKEWFSNETLYTADVIKSPNSAHMRYYYGLTLMKDKALTAPNDKIKMQYLDSAIAQFTKAKDIYPAYADAYDQLGLAYFRKGDYDKSLENYNKALSLNPGKAISYNNMGIIYFQKGDYENALKVYKKAVELNPRYADAYMNLGSVYGTMGKLELAIENFEKSIEYNPGNAMCNYYLGITYKALNNEEKANYYLNRAYELDPSLKK